MRFTFAFAGLLLSACAPLTFSERAALDFTSYPVALVRVRVSLTDSDTATGYLATELRKSSGFQHITTTPGDPPLDIVAADSHHSSASR